MGITCNRCGATDLFWKRVSSKFVLYEIGQVPFPHDCALWKKRNAPVNILRLRRVDGTYSVYAVHGTTNEYAITRVRANSFEDSENAVTELQAKYPSASLIEQTIGDSE